MTMLHVIRPDGTYTSEDYVGELTYGTPAWATLRELVGLKENELLEHVSVLWKGKQAHMLVDEEGRLHKKPYNEKATAIYYNCTFQRHRFFTYNDLAKPPPRSLITAIISPGFDIVGNAVLWEGGME